MDNYKKDIEKIKENIEIITSDREELLNIKTDIKTKEEDLRETKSNINFNISYIEDVNISIKNYKLGIIVCAALIIGCLISEASASNIIAVLLGLTCGPMLITDLKDLYKDKREKQAYLDSIDYEALESEEVELENKKCENPDLSKKINEATKWLVDAEEILNTIEDMRNTDIEESIVQIEDLINEKYANRDIPDIPEVPVLKRKNEHNGK